MVDLEKITNVLTKAVKPLDDLSGAIEAILLTLVTKFASYLASVPNAIMVTRSVEQVFDLSFGLALAIAISLELIAHALVAHWQATKAWNASKRKVDQPANENLALALVILYFLLDFGMVAVLAYSTYQTTQDWRIFVSLAYPLIGVFTALTTNARSHLFRLQQAAENDRQETREKRQERRQKTRQKSKPQPTRNQVTQPAETGLFSQGGNSAGRETKSRAMAILAERGDISGSELGRLLGKSASLGRTLKRELSPVMTETQPAETQPAEMEIAGYRGNGRKEAL